jgi:hypothetical protein
VRAHEELILRCAQKRRKKIGGLSDEGFEELLLAVRENPANFIDDREEEAFARLGAALDRYHASCTNDDALDDTEFKLRHDKRLKALSSSCKEAAAISPECTDARLLIILVEESDSDKRLDDMYELAKSAPTGDNKHRPDAWDDVFAHPRLRLRDAIARALVESSRYRMAQQTCEQLLSDSPSDALGARRTLALVLARLEDEEGLNDLDGRYPDQDNLWINFGRAMLLYKLGRMYPAQRALRGFDKLSRGGAYALLRPVFVEPYLPDRPQTKPGSFDEAIQLMHDAETIIDDTPGFVDWTQGLDWLVASAKSFGRESGYGW